MRALEQCDERVRASLGPDGKVLGRSREDVGRGVGIGAPMPGGGGCANEAVRRRGTVAENAE